eukprot:764108-Hanusia_phi.AAC.3
MQFLQGVGGRTLGDGVYPGMATRGWQRQDAAMVAMTVAMMVMGGGASLSPSNAFITSLAVNDCRSVVKSDGASTRLKAVEAGTSTAGGGGGISVNGGGWGGGGGGFDYDAVKFGLFFGQEEGAEWRRKKIFITGATGGIGRCVVTSLLQTTKHNIVCLVRDPKMLQLPKSVKDEARS